MGYFHVRYDSRVVNYDHRGFLRLTTDSQFIIEQENQQNLRWYNSTAGEGDIPRYKVFYTHKENVSVL